MKETMIKLEMLKTVYSGLSSAEIIFAMVEKSIEIGRLNDSFGDNVKDFVPAMQLACQNHTIITRMTIRFVDELYRETFSGNATADVVIGLMKKYQESLNAITAMNAINLKIAEEQLNERRGDYE